MSQDVVRYNQSGEVASYRAEDNAPVYDFDRGWGNRLEADKDSLDGQTVIIKGIEQGEDFGMGMTYFLLLNFENDPPNLDAWGIMFSSDSPIVKQTRSMVNVGRFPFRAKMVKHASQQHKGQSYWTLEKPEQPALPEVSDAGKSKRG